VKKKKALAQMAESNRKEKKTECARSLEKECAHVVGVKFQAVSFQKKLSPTGRPNRLLLQFPPIPISIKAMASKRLNTPDLKKSSSDSSTSH
jgi:hypothetical protein